MREEVELSDHIPFFDNRITRMFGIDIPIANAPMGGVASPGLVAAVANAGAMGLVPGSIGAKNALEFIGALRTQTSFPFGVNVPVFFTEESIVEVLVEQQIRFVTTSTGPVPAFVARLQQAGTKVFHVVTSLDSAKQAADAGVDGLIVEGSEGGGLRGVAEIPLMVLLPLVTSRIDLPVIAAGGIADGRSMAAAFALGAEGVQIGTRMVAAVEAGVHDNLKNAIVSAETESIIINRHNQRPLRVLRTQTTERYQDPSTGDAFKELMLGVYRLYQDGDMNAGFASVGQVAGRVEQVLPIAEIIRSMVDEFGQAIVGLSAGYMRTLA
ncbi:MAG: nitronate monooxygenase [Rhizorhabdus sp.]|nr:nitronate monooxygenase [Rhizorhabdus sp.]